MNRIYTLFLGCLMAFLSNLLPAQDPQLFSLSGMVTGRFQQMEISLYDGHNQLVKTEIADESGHFGFYELKSGNYRLKITANGSGVYHSENIQLIQNIILPVIDLSIKTIEEVTITRAKSFIERQEGKMILNVESSISGSGSSAFEILGKAPGVTIDNDDNISFRGTGNLLVQIDGKNTPMTGNDLGNYLRGISSSSIEKIEFITNPSSRYDAAGSSIINIKLKKGQKRGTNGTISSSLGTGKYIKNNNSISINHRNKKVNIFASYSFTYRDIYNHLVLDRNFYENNQFEKANIQDNFLKFGIRNHLVKSGIDYYMSDKSIIGFSAGLMTNNFRVDGDNSNLSLGSSYLPESTFKTMNTTNNHLTNPSFNINHKYSLDSLGSELITDLDYINYSSNSLQNFETKIYDPSGNLNRTDILKGNMEGKLNIFSFKSDLIKNLNHDWKLESGLKTSIVSSDNDLQFFDGSSGVLVPDLTKTNHFIYEENINAVFGNVSKKWKKIKITAGLRIENTNVKGTQITTNQVNKRNYTQLFPSAVLVYDITDKGTLEASMSRRISRPTYSQLNPFRFYLDPTTMKAGNPYLNPQITMNYELTYGLYNKYFATLAYSKISDNIINVVKPVVENAQNIAIQTNENISSVSNYSLNLITPVKVTPWWEMNNSAVFYYKSYTGNVSGTQITNKGNFVFNISSIHSFKLGDGFSAEVTGNYQAKEIYAYLEASPYWFVNIGAQKKFKNTSVLKLSVNDVFFTSNIGGQSVYNNYLENFTVRRDSRVVTLSYTYNFGSSKNGQPRKTGGADDLKERLGS